RIMRVIEEGQPGHANNRGYVVSHVGLNNEEHWSDFRDFDLADQEAVQRWLHEMSKDAAGDEEDTSREGGGQPRRFDEMPAVAGEIISHFLRDQFLDPEDDRVIEKILASEVVAGLTVRDIGVTPEALRATLRAKFASGPKQEPPGPATPIAPQRARQAARKRLSERLQSVGARVLADLELSRAGRDLAQAEGKSARMNNAKLIATLLNQAVNDHLGRDSGTRPDWSREEAERAYNNLDQVADTLRDRLHQKLGQRS
ncbi:MAG: hypothetical protein NUW01_02040, partial [Gemmatimonadaceae bacterium]|nr:hypothetical protein [Gemmatimonadaceae bacterium]